MEHPEEYSDYLPVSRVVNGAHRCTIISRRTRQDFAQLELTPVPTWSDLACRVVRSYLTSYLIIKLVVEKDVCDPHTSTTIYYEHILSDCRERVTRRCYWARYSTNWSNSDNVIR